VTKLSVLVGIVNGMLSQFNGYFWTWQIMIFVQCLIM